MNLHQKPDLVPSVPSMVPGTRKMHWTRRISTWGLVAAVSVVAITENAIAQGLKHQATPAEVPSLFDPEQAKAHPMTQEQRWQLDFELANEVGMMDHNSWRFMPPNSFEKRARWYEETAKYYRIADLLQQIVDFRRSAMRNNEKAFNELVELGKAGDAGAACMAASLYQSHRGDVTETWKYSHDDVLRQALIYESSGNKVCIPTRGAVHFFGLLGEPKNYEEAKRYGIKAAVAGFYGSQRYMGLSHLEGSRRGKPSDFSLEMCWLRVASGQSPVTGFENTCDVIRLTGSVRGADGTRISANEDLLGIARHWCDSKISVTADVCANLEEKVNQSGR